MSKVANAVRQRCLRDGLSDAGCTLRVFRREVIDAFVPFATLYFMPAFAARAGFTVVEHPVRHRPRRTGKSKYGLRVMLWRPFVDMLAIGWLLRRRIPSVPVTERRPGDGRIETRNAADTEPMRTDGIIADSAERALRG
jgi:dolichol-phosphate mannosyltransferase